MANAVNASSRGYNPACLIYNRHSFIRLFPDFCRCVKTGVKLLKCINIKYC